jgi:lysozyme
MKTSPKGIALIKDFEGLRLGAYLCSAGVLTIGYGHTGGVKEGDLITEQKAEQLLQDDLKKFENGVLRLVRVPLTQNQFDALVSFAFNLGVGNLGKSTLLKMLNDRDYKGAAGQFIRWNKAAGKELAGLTRRRLAESALFLSA